MAPGYLMIPLIIEWASEIGDDSIFFISEGGGGGKLRGRQDKI